MRAEAIQSRAWRFCNGWHAYKHQDKSRAETRRAPPADERQIQVARPLAPRPQPQVAMHDADDAIARLLRRSCVPGAASLVAAATATASAKLRQQGGVELRSATRRLLAVTDARALQRECLETEKIVHSEDTSASSSQLLVFHEQVTGVVGLDEIDALRDELCGLQATKELSLEEEAYAEELEAVIVEALADAFVSGIISHDDTRRARHGDRPDDAQLWLLELAVQPSPMTRQLAFSLLLQVGISSTSILLSTMIDSSRNALRYDISKLQDELFATLREMLAKAVVVAGTASASPTHRQTRRSARATVYGELSWVEAALECIVLFTKHIDGDKGFRRDRLSQLDPLALRYLFEAVALGLPDTACAQESIVELIIVTIYTSEPRSMIASTSAPGSRSALRVSPTAFEQCCSLELLLAMLYTAVSVHTQQLLFMVLFDLACEQLFKSKNTAAPVCKDPDLLWLALLEQELPSRWLRSPLTFSSTSTPRVAKVLATAHPSLFDKSTLAVLMQLHRFLRINEYFERSVSLSSMLQVAQENSSQTDTIMRKIDELLSSCRATEKFRGELWLSELLTFGVTPSTGGSSPRGAILNGAAGCEGGGRDGTKLQETCGFSNNDKVRCAAQDKLWNLIGDSSLPAERMSFARVATLFVRRLLHSKVMTIRQMLWCINDATNLQLLEFGR